MPITKTIILYTAKELQALDSRAFARALAQWADDANHSCWLWNDAQATLKQIEPLLKGKHWDVPFSSASRALRWLENNILALHRIPWYGKRRWDVAKYGRHYRPGMVRPCPFTGVHFDEIALDAMRDAARNGLSVKDIYLRVKETLEQAIESEVSFLTYCEDLGVLFHPNGDKYEGQ